MADATFLWVALAVWVLGGLGGYYYLRRHGHPHPVWLLAGMVLGPFAILVFLDRVERSAHVLVERDAPTTAGTSIVVGLDGSPAAEHALQVARRLLGCEQCCLVLCEVVDYDTEDDPSGEGVAAATGRLEQAAARLPAGSATIEVMAGRPAQALAQAAEQHDADLVVVGTRGHGLSRHLLGSVAEDLLTLSDRPVLVVHQR